MKTPSLVQDFLSKDDALALITQSEDALFASATALRERYFGDKVELCAIINARSGKCHMDCAFCSQSIHNATENIPVFSMLSAAELQNRLNILAEFPLRRVGIVTSGGALAPEDVDTVITVLETMPAHWHKRLCGSLGRLPLESLRRLAQAGLTRYHHNLESSEAFYPKICTSQSWHERKNTVQRAQDLGLECCVGGLFGLGESWEDRIDFAFSLRTLGVKHVPINFLYAHAGTPLAHVPPLSASDALRIIALLRHVLPWASLRICGGRPHVLRQRQALIFAAGANALMTGNYLTTQGEGVEEDCTMISSQGLNIVC